VDPGGPRDGVPDGTPDGTPGDAQEAPGAHPPTDPRPTDQERTP
jgi:acetyl-CoA/propionyl-CoA carboxylase, biotin carboxylase, biotin carboxyl carrier protein